MKSRTLLLTVISAGLLASALAASRGPRSATPSDTPPSPAPVVCPKNPECTPDPTCPAPGQNQNCQAQCDGTGGKNQPAHPGCPREGGSCPRRG